MRPKFTREKVRNFLRLAPVFLAFCFTGTVFGQPLINGPLSTGATSSGGTAAPAGYTWSELQVALGGNSLGENGNIDVGTSLADDFTVPAGQVWNITKLTVYGYQTGFVGATSPFNRIQVRIHSSNPALGPTTIVFGDLTTNRFIASTDALMYRIGTTVNQDRKIWATEANVTTSLPAGTYWIEYRTGITTAGAHFLPNVTTAGSMSQPGNNAVRNVVGPWEAITDGVPAVAQALPFKLDYTATGTPCSTPAPGNTLSTQASVCPSATFTLSLQNATTGVGVTYQWQRSTTGVGGPFTDIPSATSATLATSQTVATAYRCNVRCATGPSTTASNPVQVNMNAITSCYCVPPNTDCTDDDVILNVKMNTLNNSSGCSAPTGYTDYTTTVAATDVIIGAPNSITVTGGAGWSRAVAVWIDYDRNGVFDASEFTAIASSAATATPHTANINVPAGLTTGITRMRVRWRFGTTQFTAAQACTNPSGFGETEDYAVNLVPCVQGVFTTVPANRSVQCSGTTTFNVAATGSLLSYSWQYRTSASGPWLTVPNAVPYSNVNTNTLTLTNVTSTMNGYQYRALITGPCTAVDFSSPPATLTVTPLVATVTPTSATICVGDIQKISLTNIVSPVNLINEGFASITPLPTGWSQQNLSSPLGGLNWFQGNPAVFASHSGAPDGYIAANFNNTSGAGTISNWLITPAVTIKDGDQFSFWARANDGTPNGGPFPDRLQARMSTNGTSTNVGATATSVGDFTTLLVDINPTLTTTGFPFAWTQYTVTITGVPTPVTGRFAFRYFVTNGGPSGANSDFIGVDDVVFTSNGTPQGVWTANPATPNTMFTDAAATVPYVAGTPVGSIWVKPTVNTTYSVVYSTTTPCVSGPTNIPVTVVTPVSAPVAPANRTACVGGSVTFTTSATGGPLTYQWQVSTNGGASFTNLANGTGVAGATTASLTLSGLTATMNNNQYRAVITAAPCAGSTVTTTAATLTVNPIPVITIAAPVTQLVPGGSTTITATSTTAGLTYVWSRNGTANGVTGATQFVNIDSLGTYRVTGTLPGVSGCVAQSNSLVIGAQASDRLWIYPNPTDGQFQVRLYYDATSAPERREFAIFNPDGQQVATRSLDIVRGMSPFVQTNFDLRHLAAGTYVVKVTEKRTGKIVAGLIVIQ